MSDEKSKYKNVAETNNTNSLWFRAHGDGAVLSRRLCSR